MNEKDSTHIVPRMKSRNDLIRTEQEASINSKDLESNISKKYLGKKLQDPNNSSTLKAFKKKTKAKKDSVLTP